MIRGPYSGDVPLPKTALEGGDMVADVAVIDGTGGQIACEEPWDFLPF